MTIAMLNDAIERRKVKSSVNGTGRAEKLKASVTREAELASDIKVSAKDINLYYNELHALKDISLDIANRQVTALIGPSGCGKSSFLRSLNRMNDIIEGCRLTGQILMDGADIMSDMEVTELRSRVGMVFQQPNPFPMSVWKNVAYGPRIQGVRDRSLLDEIVETSLKKAALWDELKDRLKSPALSLSGGQQQRLCIARAIAMSPEVILMDEPTSALDPIATERIEQLIKDLREDYAIVIVTHSMNQAIRLSDWTAFFLMGELVEAGRTAELFTNPLRDETSHYIGGRFG